MNLFKLAACCVVLVFCWINLIVIGAFYLLEVTGIDEVVVMDRYKITKIK